MTKPVYPFPKMILFDWDNTLMDTTPALYKAFSVMRDRYDLPHYTMSEYQARTGLSMRETFPQMFGDKWEEARKIYLDAYQANHIALLVPFADAKEVVAFAAEKVCKVGVVSNKTSSILKKEIDHLQWNEYFSAVVGAGDAPKDKPAPDPVYLALEQAGLHGPQDVWFVGDGDADVLCAKNAGCLPVRVAEENKDGADVLTVKNCTELLLVLYSLVKSR